MKDTYLSIDAKQTKEILEVGTVKLFELVKLPNLPKCSYTKGSIYLKVEFDDYAKTRY